MQDDFDKKMCVSIKLMCFLYEKQMGLYKSNPRSAHLTTGRSKVCEKCKIYTVLKLCSV